MNKDELAAIGIDVEEVKAGVIERAAEMVTEMVKHDIRDAVLERVQNAIGENINQIIQDVLGNVYVPINRWGEQIKEATTIRDEFGRAVEEWWKQPVDSEGKPTSDHYHQRPRYEYVAKQVIGDVLKADVSGQLFELVRYSKKTLQEAVNAAIRRAVDRAWAEADDEAKRSS